MSASGRSSSARAAASSIAPPPFAPVPLSTLSDPELDDAPLPLQLVRQVVAVAGMAPSIYNTQPWCFRSDGYVIDLFADRNRQLHRADPSGRLLSISCGAALHHAQLAVCGLGRDAEVLLLPDGSSSDHLARLVVGPRLEQVPTPDDWALLQAVCERHTHRDAFTPRRLSRGLVVDLEEVVAAQGCGLRAVERPGERADVAGLVASAKSLFEADEQAQAELTSWSRWEGDIEAGSSIWDGIPRSVVAHGAAAANGRFKQREFDVDGTVAATTAGADQLPAPEDPDVTALFTTGDTAADWLQAGVALSALLLTATCGGVAASMLNQPVDDPVLRVRLGDALKVAGFVQILLRLGYSEVDAQSPMTPRRLVDDILTWE
jgi:hypothetical protein